MRGWLEDVVRTEKVKLGEGGMVSVCIMGERKDVVRARIECWYGQIGCCLLDKRSINVLNLCNKSYN